MRPLLLVQQPMKMAAAWNGIAGKGGASWQLVVGCLSWREVWAVGIAPGLRPCSVDWRAASRDWDGT